MSDTDKLLSSLKSLKALIIGDVMVDIYSWGDTNRVSPEAPVPIVDVNNKEFKLGGAANVAKNINALGAESILCGVVGNEEYSQVFIDLLKKNSISGKFIYKSSNRKTTTKHRVFSGGKQVLRIDDEDTHDLSKGENAKLLEHIENNIKKVDVVILEDYDKGVLNKKNIKQIIDLAHKHNKLVVVDPKKSSFSLYKEVDLFKPNLKELSDGIEINLDNFDESDLSDAVDKLKKKLKIDNVLLTLSERGLYVDFRGNKHFIQTKTGSVLDVSGAGDTAMSIASLLFVKNTEPKLLGTISNIAGGLACESVGVVSIGLDELKRHVKKITNLQ